MTRKRFKLLYSKLDNGMFVDREKQFEDIIVDKEFQKIGLIKLVDLLNNLSEENEQLKRQIGNLEHTKDFCAEVCADCERLEKENEQLKQRCKELRNDLIDHSALIKMLEDTKALKIEDMIWNTMDYKIQIEFDDDFADYREDAKKRWRE